MGANVVGEGTLQYVEGFLFCADRVSGRMAYIAAVFALAVAAR